MFQRLVYAMTLSGVDARGLCRYMLIHPNAPDFVYKAHKQYTWLARALFFISTLSLVLLVALPHGDYLTAGLLSALGASSVSLIFIRKSVAHHFSRHWKSMTRADAMMLEVARKASAQEQYEQVYRLIWKRVSKRASSIDEVVFPIEELRSLLGTLPIRASKRRWIDDMYGHQMLEEANTFR